MSLRVGHQINYYSIPLQFSIIKRHKDNLNLSNTDSRLARGKYDTGFRGAAASRASEAPSWVLPGLMVVEKRQQKARVGWSVQGRIFRAKLTLISSRTGGTKRWCSSNFTNCQTKIGRKAGGSPHHPPSAKLRRDVSRGVGDPQ